MKQTNIATELFEDYRNRMTELEKIIDCICDMDVKAEEETEIFAEIIKGIDSLGAKLAKCREVFENATLPQPAPNSDSELFRQYLLELGW
jgi:hypothetical protein